MGPKYKIKSVHEMRPGMVWYLLALLVGANPSLTRTVMNIMI